MTTRSELLALVACVALTGSARADEQDSGALLQALPKAKVTLADGIKQAAHPPAAPISAKFEMDDKGQLSLSVYTAAKGLGADAEHNTLQELSGSPGVRFLEAGDRDVQGSGARREGFRAGDAHEPHARLAP